MHLPRFRREPEVVVPRWRQLPSGLFIPSSVAHRLETMRDEPLLPAELVLPTAPVAVVDRLPTSADQMVGALNEEELGLPPASLDELLDWARLLPFEPLMLLFGRIAARIWHMRDDAAAQLRLMESWRMPNLLAAATAAMERDRGGMRMVVFAEQYLTALQRVLVDRARPRGLNQGASEPELRGGIAAYFATSTVVSAADADLREGDAPPERWFAYQLKNAVYNNRPSLVNVLTRYHELLDVLPHQFVGHTQHCDINAWMRDIHGLAPIEQPAVGFYAYAMTHALEENPPFEELSVVTHPFARSALADRVDRIEDLLSAPRNWYREAFGETDDDLDTLAWERRPFLQRPFLRSVDGRWILLFPRAMESWLGEGLHYRALDAAAVRGETRRYNNFFGHLVERYCLELAQSAYPLDRPVGSGRAHPEQVYGRRGGRRTFDIALDFGTDLVAIEIVAARVTAEMQVYGRPELLAAELEKMIFKKVRQIASPVAAVLSGEAQIPDVRAAEIARVWPLIVTAGPIVVTELLWGQIDAMTPPELRVARVGPLCILDIDDFELLLAMGAVGHHLPTLLATWRGGPYRDLDFARFAHQELRIDPALRLPIISDRYEALGRRTRETLFPRP